MNLLRALNPLFFVGLAQGAPRSAGPFIFAPAVLTALGMDTPSYVEQASPDALADDEILSRAAVYGVRTPVEITFYAGPIWHPIGAPRSWALLKAIDDTWSLMLPDDDDRHPRLIFYAPGPTNSIGETSLQLVALDLEIGAYATEKSVSGRVTGASARTEPCPKMPPQNTGKLACSREPCGIGRVCREAFLAGVDGITFECDCQPGTP